VDRPAPVTESEIIKRVNLEVTKGKPADVITVFQWGGPTLKAALRW
jgi:hypothetical protein